MVQFQLQVSHHPPILAYHFENMLYGYTIYGEAEIKNKFWGKSVEVIIFSAGFLTIFNV